MTSEPLPLGPRLVLAFIFIVLGLPLVIVAIASELCPGAELLYLITGLNIISQLAMVYGVIAVVLILKERAS